MGTEMFTKDKGRKALDCPFKKPSSLDSVD